MPVPAVDAQPAWVLYLWASLIAVAVAFLAKLASDSRDERLGTNLPALARRPLWSRARAPDVGFAVKEIGFKWTRGHSFSGTIGGRPALLIARMRPNEAPELTFLIHVEHAPPLRIARESVAGNLGRWLVGTQSEVVTGDARFDNRFAVKTSDQARAREALGAPLRQLVATLFDSLGVEEIETTKTPERYEEVHHFGKERVLAVRVRQVPRLGGPQLAARLGELARALEGVRLVVRALGGERRALKGSHGKARCAWCHADLEGSEPELVACEKCSTVLHGECWAEQGGCPILGCAGKTAERARAH